MLAAEKKESLQTIRGITLSVIGVAIVIGLIVMFVFSMFGLEKISSLVWGFSQNHKVYFKEGDEYHTYNSFDLNVMRMFIVLSIILIVDRSLSLAIKTSLRKIIEVTIKSLL
tara:strand:- start:16 stop:351 length:336 start_codon:yes stop_codon:yes gene_type:complete